ncbi:MAG: protein translocase subunit SecD [Candidatus Gastranaerophilales bacterium]|nr:protein translocase subunit SecD [Candidatus Gastranaerophilales bacterium]
MKTKIILFWVIVAIALAGIFVIYKKPTSLGLDLVGGSRLVLEAVPSSDVTKITPDVMDSLQYAIENRVNALGVGETIVQKVGDKRLMVEIPNITDTKKAKEFLGETAQLEFKEPGAITSDGMQEWISTGLTGKDLKKAAVSTSSTGEWIVSLEFNAEGAKKFADLTRRLVGKPMAIFFNGKLSSSPRINEEIIGGHAQISGGGEGGFEYTEVKDMVDLLNAGALPVGAKIIEENSVGPSLGADSIQKSKFAGIIGISLVMLFMICYYRVPGVIASIALCIYSIITFAIFKLIPVTLTLAGIAGFILSVGMAVDANILIFERTKEELKTGRSLFTAINSGFDRAFTSIFDSNMSTIITCLILYLLGTGTVKGFALTLAIGVLVSMFSAITITKNLMHLVFGTGELKHPALFGLKKSDINKSYTAVETKKEKAKFGVLN